MDIFRSLNIEDDQTQHFLNYYNGQHRIERNCQRLPEINPPAERKNSQQVKRSHKCSKAKCSDKDLGNGASALYWILGILQLCRSHALQPFRRRSKWWTNFAKFFDRVVH